MSGAPGMTQVSQTVSKANDAPVLEAVPHGAVAEAPSALPGHLAALPGGGWAVWRNVCLRGAGFPAGGVLRLGAPAYAAAADALLDAEERAARERGRLLDALREDLSGAEAAAQSEHASALRHARRRAQKNRVPEPLAFDCAANAARPGWLAAQNELAQARARLTREFEAAVAQTSQALCEVARAPRFREAVIWQSRRAFHTGVEALLREAAAAAPRNTHRRQHEELIATYWQRYCTKNDTIGFFGPVGWARFVETGPALAARPGADLLATRNVYFESWAVDALGEALVAEKGALRQWLAPRLSPLYDVSGRTLHVPLGNPVPLSPGQAELLRLCDGERPARELAGELIPRHPAEFKTAADVYRVLGFLSTKAVVIWGFEVPLSARPERGLAHLLEGVGDGAGRAEACARLSALGAARDEVAAARDAESLDRALGELETTFTRVTGRASSRAAGQMYAGRALVYEDCRRDVEVELGPELLAELGPPLSLLLAGARWLTHEIAAACRHTVGSIYRDLARKAQTSVVEGTAFWLKAQAELLDADSDTVRALQSRFHARWAEVLALPAGARRVRRSCAEVGEAVRRLFDAPAPGWHAARYHSPDIMIAAEGADAIRRGEYEFVMGELHIGVNTQALSLFVEQHPSRAELLRAAAADIPEPRVLAVAPRVGSRLSGRNHMGLVTPKDFRLEFSVHSDKAERAQALPLGTLVVEERAGRLEVRTRDGRLSFDIVEVLADAVTAQVLNSFKLLRPSRHSPRVNLDRLVVARESWAFTAGELEFAFEKSEEARFCGARRWARAEGLPRFVFVKSPVEVKPVYVDLSSAVYVDLLARIVRRTREGAGAEASLAVTEMLPRLEQAWLPDAAGQLYTSELRIVAVDQAGATWAPPPDPLA